MITTSIRVFRSRLQLSEIRFRLKKDNVAQEYNETFTISLSSTPVILENTTIWATINGTIIDSDSKHQSKQGVKYESVFVPYVAIRVWK